MEIVHSPSRERIGFAAMAALILGPIFFQPLWLLLSLLGRVEADARSLTLAALVVTVAAVVERLFFQKRMRIRSSAMAIAVGFGAAFLLATSLKTWVSMAVAFMFLATLASIFVAWLVRRLPADMDGLASQNKIKTGLFVLISAFSIWQTARVSTFMGDAKRMEYSAMPDIEFLKNHSCLTAYVHALKLANAYESNLYEASLWPDELELTKLRGEGLAKTGPYAPFFLDNYMYPPQFLLLPGALLGWSDDFNLQRAIWFGFCGLFLAFSFWMVAMWVGEKGSRHGLWLIPLLWSSIVMLVTLQVGNIHHVVMAMAVVAMVAFDLKKPLWGGALLAFAILAKISPGILVIVLLAQRRWRDLAWTAAFGLSFTLLTVLFFGMQPVESFIVYQLPRLLSGESMKWFATSDLNILVNSGPFSTPFKLSMLGVKFDDIWGTARLINTFYTLSIVGITIWASLRSRNRMENLCLWLGVLMLSSLQSPFSPGYVVMPVIWLLTFLSIKIKNVFGLLVFTILWFLIAFPIPGTATINVLLALTQQVMVLAIIGYALLLRHRVSEGLAA